MLSHKKPDLQLVHEMTVTNIIDKQKEFNSGEGRKKKYIIEFDNDNYAAEYCPLVSNGIDSRIKLGQKLLFRIIYRKDFGDEITPYTLPSEPVKLSETSISGKVINVHGHPATVALNAASHIYAAKIEAGTKEEDYGIASMLEDADTIKKWLINSIENPE